MIVMVYNSVPCIKFNAPSLSNKFEVEHLPLKDETAQ